MFPANFEFLKFRFFIFYFLLPYLGRNLSIMGDIGPGKSEITRYESRLWEHFLYFKHKVVWELDIVVEKSFSSKRRDCSRGADY